MSIPTNFSRRQARFLSGLFSTILLLTLALSHASGAGCCSLIIEVFPDKVTINRVEYPVEEVPTYLKKLEETFGINATKEAGLFFDESTPVSRILEIIQVLRNADCSIPTLYIGSKSGDRTPISFNLKYAPPQGLSHDPNRTTSPAPVDSTGP